MIANPYWEAFKLVADNKVRFDGTGREFTYYLVVDSISVGVGIKDGISVMTCSCKFHSVKDVKHFALCSYKLAVVLHKFIFGLDKISDINSLLQTKINIMKCQQQDSGGKYEEEMKSIDKQLAEEAKTLANATTPRAEG